MRVIYLDIDSLRPDHLGCYGYHRATSPNIDRLAARGVRFNNYYASDVPCLPSRTALFTGCSGFATGVVNHGGTQADLRLQGPTRGFRSDWARNALPQRLRDAGWYTASITPFPNRHSAYHMWYGFHEMHDTGWRGDEIATQVTPYWQRFLDQHGRNDRWFLHLNLWDPHTPYRTPLEFGNPFENDPPPAWLTDEVIARHRASFGPHEACAPHSSLFNEAGRRAWRRGTDQIRTVADWKRWIDGYDVAVRFADAELGKMLARLEELGIADDTAVIVSADHGENQGELEVYGDHQTADQICCRVPLVVHWPGVTDAQRGRACGGLHYNFDLAATLVELMGGEAPAAWEAQSFAPALQGEADVGREELILSQGAWACQRAVRWDHWILIRTYHTGLKNYPSLMLFDLERDPHETTNLAGSRPEVVGEGLRRLERWLTEQHRRFGGPDPLFQVMHEGGPLHARQLPDWMERNLRSTGRGAYADWLAVHPGTPRDGMSSFE